MEAILSKASELVINYWPVVIAVLVTFVTVHSIKYIFRTFGEGKRRLYTRLAAFAIGFAATFICLRAFTDIPGEQVRYLALFVGLFNPAMYFLLMLYLRLKKPESYETLSAALKHHAAENGIEEIRNSDNQLEKVKDHGQTVWKRVRKD
jgi:hypothetical protein